MRQVLLNVMSFSLLFAGTSLSQASTDTQDANDPVKGLTLQEMGEQLWKTSSAICVMTRKHIRRSGVTTMPDALRRAAGVEVARIDGGKWSIGIRGFGSRLTRDMLVLIDGRTAYTILLASTDSEVQNVLLEDVDRIEIIRGEGDPGPLVGVKRNVCGQITWRG
jgi:iron complex outermembrane receptor protein